MIGYTETAQLHNERGIKFVPGKEQVLQNAQIQKRATYHIIILIDFPLNKQSPRTIRASPQNGYLNRNILTLGIMIRITENSPSHHHEILVNDLFPVNFKSKRNNRIQWRNLLASAALKSWPSW